MRITATAETPRPEERAKMVSRCATDANERSGQGRSRARIGPRSNRRAIHPGSTIAFDIKSEASMRRFAFAFLATAALQLPAIAQQSEPYGWLNNETLKTPYGDFEFENGYPAGDSGQRLLDIQTLNRAVDVYTTQMMRVSEIALREGLRAFGAQTPQQVVIWELMGPQTVLLTRTLKRFTRSAIST
jgi:hypothetical protein